MSHGKGKPSEHYDLLGITVRSYGLEEWREATTTGVVLKMIQVIAFLTSGLPYGALGLGGDLPESKLKALT